MVTRHAAIPAAWALARLLVRRRALPSGAAIWAALLAAANPFYLWYGRGVCIRSCRLLAGELLPSAARVGRGLRPAARRYLPAIWLRSCCCWARTIWPCSSCRSMPSSCSCDWPHGAAGRPAWSSWVCWRPAHSLPGRWTARAEEPGRRDELSVVSLPVMARPAESPSAWGSVDVSRVLWLDLVFAALAIIGIAWPLRRTG